MMIDGPLRGHLSALLSEVLDACLSAYGWQQVADLLPEFDEALARADPHRVGVLMGALADVVATRANQLEGGDQRRPVPPAIRERIYVLIHEIKGGGARQDGSTRTPRRR